MNSMTHLEPGALSRIVLPDSEMVAIYSLTDDFNEVEFRSGDIVMILNLIYVDGHADPIYACVMKDDVKSDVALEFLAPLDVV